MQYILRDILLLSLDERLKLIEMVLHDSQCSGDSIQHFFRTEPEARVEGREITSTVRFDVRN